MAGGQSASFEQGSPGVSGTVALSGSAITSGIGLLNVGSDTYQAVTGQAFSSAIGSTGSARLILLKSRKVGGGAASFALTGIGSTMTPGVVANGISSPLVGQVSTLAQGAMTKASSRALTGITLTGDQGIFSNSTTSAPTFSFNPWRSITTDSSKNPFLNGAKHVMWVWHPVKKRVYTFSGDYSTGSANFATGGNDGQLNEGSSFYTNASPQTGPYSMSGSLRNDQFSLDPYATNPVQWRLEHQALPRNFSGSMEARPARPDQSSLIWDPVRNKFWAIYTALRTEFLYLNGGVPDQWANGSLVTSPVWEPSGTWSWTPSVTGPNGTWTFESAARTVVRAGYATQYESGNILVTSSASERIAFWERDPTTDRVFGVGTDKVFIFNPSTVTYEWRNLSTTGYSFFSMSSSMVAILGNYMYAYAYARESGTGTRRSYLVRINISAMLALSNGGTVTNFTLHLMPWSLSHKHMVNGIDGQTYDDTFGVWEGQNQGFENWTEKNGLYSIDGKIVCAGTYNGIYDAGAVGYPSGSVPATTRLHVFAPSTLQFYQCDTPPDTAICASSWVTLPDSYEILMGLSSIGYGGTNLWAYRPTHIGPLRVEDFSANEGYDPEPNMNGQVKWQTSYTLNDGGLIFWGTGGHGTSDNNSVRKYWPSTKSVTRLYENNFGTQDQQQYDNKNYWYIPAVDKLVIPDRGVFNVSTGVWDIGTLPPASNNGYQVIGTGTNDFIYPDSSMPSPISYFSASYNGFQAWSAEYDCGVVFSQGHDLQPQPDMYFVVKSSNLGNGKPNRYTIYHRTLPTYANNDNVATLLKARARDGCCFMGDYVYWVGGGDYVGGPTGASNPTKHFFRMNIVPHLTSTNAAINIERLTDCPVALEFGWMQPDKYLNALLLVCDSGIFAYDLTYGQWINLTSQTSYQSNWGGAYGGYMPGSCLGGFVDTHAGSVYRRFYWRPGANDSWGYDSTNWAKFFSLKLTRS